MEKSNAITIDLGELKQSCFIIMPFSSQFQTQYEKVIRPAVEETGLVCIRGDEIFSKPQIMSDIWKELRSARVVIAELTGKNPNVLYEVGLAHAIGKPIVIITREESDVPFDLKALRYRYYDTSDPYWGINLKTAIKTMIESILTEKQFGTVLEGISSEGLINYPEVHKPMEPRPKPVESIFDLTGVWKAEWAIPKGNESTKNSATFNILQKGNELTVEMTVSFLGRGEMTVVRQEMSGSLDKDNVRLQGTSYTYIRQGSSPYYALDTFNGKIVDDKTIVALTADEDVPDAKIKVTLKKL
jgi:hypothetical protein